MKAPIQMQRKLLDLQKMDIQIAKINHFLSTMPIDEKIKENNEKLFKIEQLLLLAKTKIADTNSKIEILNKDIETVENRIKKQQERAESSAYSPKEINAILGEIEQMNKRKKNLENNEVSLLEEITKYEEKLDKILKTQEKLKEIANLLEEEKKEKSSQFLVDKKEIEHERKILISQIDEELFKFYEKVKKITGGIGAVAMRGNRVEGMSLEFSIAELDEIRKTPIDEVITSQDYDYMLIRIEE